MAYKDLSVLAIIPARAGSKRLPNKNVLPLDTRPLLAYSILAARASEYVDDVAVSSDSTVVLEAAKPYGARLILRPPALATDESPTMATVNHAHRQMEKITPRPWDIVVLLQPNVPLRLGKDIDLAVAELVDKEADSSLTVDFVYPKFGHEDELGYQPDYKPGARKQDLTPMLRENGVLYVLTRGQVLIGQLFGEKTLPRASRTEQSIANIDYQVDFDICTALYHSPRFPYKNFFNSIDPPQGEK